MNFNDIIIYSVSSIIVLNLAFQNSKHPSVEFSISKIQSIHYNLYTFPILVDNAVSCFYPNDLIPLKFCALIALLWHEVQFSVSPGGQFAPGSVIFR